jgi:hypothetical protein
LEGVEDRLSIFDFSDFVCVVESVDTEVAVTVLWISVARKF